MNIKLHRDKINLLFTLEPGVILEHTLPRGISVYKRRRGSINPSESFAIFCGVAGLSSNDYLVTYGGKKKSLLALSKEIE